MSESQGHGPVHEDIRDRDRGRHNWTDLVCWIYIYILMYVDIYIDIYIVIYVLI